ncbi:MAG: HIT domain-containing protein [Burkholderiaceae bacterium]|nr:HIT domain-containing protein [Burkholderiaceae bacterium]
MVAISRDCPFCNFPPRRVLLRSEHCIAIRDAFPVVVGHTLVIPTRHVQSIFDLQPNELANIAELVKTCAESLRVSEGVDDFNIGVNDGPAAGQTVAHAHIHLIPRKYGDVEDPRGGIRWLFPDKAQYWR